MKHSVFKVITKIVAGCFICYVAFTLITLQVSIAQKRREVEELENKVKQQEIINEETKKMLDESDLEDLIRRFAESQGYAYQGEKIFIDESDN